jgi:hypothetical protein
MIAASSFNKACGDLMHPLAESGMLLSSTVRQLLEFKVVRRSNHERSSGLCD